MGDWNVGGPGQPRPFDQESESPEPSATPPAPQPTPPASQPTPAAAEGRSPKSPISLPRYTPPTPPAQRPAPASTRTPQAVERPTSAPPLDGAVGLPAERPVGPPPRSVPLPDGFPAEPSAQPRDATHPALRPFAAPDEAPSAARSAEAPGALEPLADEVAEPPVTPRAEWAGAAATSSEETDLGAPGAIGGFDSGSAAEASEFGDVAAVEESLLEPETPAATTSWEGRSASIWDVPKPPPDWDGGADEPVAPVAEEPVPEGTAPDLEEPEVEFEGAGPSGGSPFIMPTREGRSPWLYAVIGLVVGVLIGGGLLAWQRVAMLAEQRELEERLQSMEESASLSAEQVATMSERMATYEASLTAQASQITSLSSELASSQAALTLAESKIAQTAKTLTITERSVSPESVEKGKSLTLVVKIKGKADEVSMKIVGVSSTSFSKTYSLTKTETVGGIETWTRTVDAPTTVGTYRYHATAKIGTKTFEMPGVSAWTFEVKGTP